MQSWVAAAILATTALAGPVAAQAPAGEVTWIHAGHLIDRPGEAPRGPSTISIRDGKVAEIRDGLVPAEAGGNVCRSVARPLCCRA